MEKFKKIIMPFGKYKGEYIADIAHTDMKYLEWCLDNTDLRGELKDAIVYYVNF